MAILPQPYNTRLEAISRTTQDGFLTLVGGVLTLAAPSGVGNVSGPASSTTNAVAIYSNATGKVIKDSGVTIDSTNKVTAPSYQVGTGVIARHYNHTSYGDFWDLRTSNLNGYGKAIIGSGSYLLSSGVGTIATPSKGALNFGYHLNHSQNLDAVYMGGSIEWWNTASNNGACDLVLWASPSGSNRDKSSHTQDLAIRGQTGNVEIQRGRLILSNDIQLGGTFGPRIKNNAGFVEFRNSADSSFVGLSAASGTFSGAINANGLNVTNASDITSTTNQLNITNNSTAVSGGAALRATNNLGNSITVAIYGGGHSASHLADKGCLNSQVSLRLVTNSNMSTGGVNGIEISPGGHNRLSAIFPAAGGIDVVRGGITSVGPITSGFQTITDDSQVTTAILLPGQSRLFYNSTSDTLSTWTNVGGKLYKSQPHVEV